MRSENAINKAVEVLRGGGVIAYPTEHCFGLGCDPNNAQAVERILTIKQRKAEQGLILLGANEAQLGVYANFAALDAAQLQRVRDSWPGPNTWLIPAHANVSTLLRGHHLSIAVRFTANEICRDLLTKFGHAIVSTSANRHGQAALLEADEVTHEMGTEVDYVLELAVGGAPAPSTIRDAQSNAQLR